MIVINKEVIRTARRQSIDDERPDTSHENVESLLSSSPPMFPVILQPQQPRISTVDELRSSAATSKATDSNQRPQKGEISLEPEEVFAKVPIPAVRVASSLSKELELDRGFMHRTNASTQAAAKGGSWMNLDVFVIPGQPPVKMKVQPNNSIEEVIELVIRQWNDQKRKPQLSIDSDDYELRMVDDDDGEPDCDIPPLTRTGQIKGFGVDVVAMCERDGVLISVEETRQKRGVSLQMNLKSDLGRDGRFFLRIHMPNHVSHVLPVNSTMKLQDLLPLIAKKRSSEEESILPQHFKFVYIDDPEGNGLEMETSLSEIKTDELMLTRRVPKEEELKAFPEMNNSFDDDSVVIFTHARAHQYTEYPVIKINQRGKSQRRILGIDGEKIYNRNPEALNVLGRKISMDVRRAYRLVSEVVNVELLDNKRSFRITFKDKNGVERRDYEADTKMDANQIISKLQFLLNERAEGRH